MRRLAFCAAIALIAAAPAASVAAARHAGGPCSQPPQPYFLYNGYNNCGTLNNAKPAVFKLAKPTHITEIADYHFNNGTGAPGGTIGLQAPNGYVFGPFHAKQDQDHNWIAMMNITVPAGTYTIVDSSPSTWSQNPASRGFGFVRVFGAFVASAPALPKPKPGAKGTGTSPSTTSHPTCATPAPSTYLISPDHVAPGATPSFLLGCGKATSLGFQGAFAPTKVLIYDLQSYTNLKYVNGFLQPISPSFPVRPPVTATFKVVGPNDIDVTVPASLAPGQYTPVVVYAKGDVAPQNRLVVT